MKADRERRMVRSELLEAITVFMAVVSLRFGLSFLIGAQFDPLAGGERRLRRVPLHAIGRRRRLREWCARKKILRRHRGDSGLAVSIKVSGSRTGYAIFIIRRIGEPEDYVV